MIKVATTVIVRTAYFLCVQTIGVLQKYFCRGLAHPANRLSHQLPAKRIYQNTLVHTIFLNICITITQKFMQLSCTP